MRRIFWRSCHFSSPRGSRDIALQNRVRTLGTDTLYIAGPFLSACFMCWKVGYRSFSECTSWNYIICLVTSWLAPTHAAADQQFYFPLLFQKILSGSLQSLLVQRVAMTSATAAATSTAATAPRQEEVATAASSPSPSAAATEAAAASAVAAAALDQLLFFSPASSLLEQTALHGQQQLLVKAKSEVFLSVAATKSRSTELNVGGKWTNIEETVFPRNLPIYT
jgi:hypothetical protein